MLSLKHIADLNGHTDPVWCVAWNKNGNMLASCSSDKTVKIWKCDEDNKWYCYQTLSDGHSRTIRSVSFSPCGRYIASASFDGTVGIWLMKNNCWDLLTNLEGHENEVKCASWSPSGQYLATCSRDKSVWVWEVDEDEDFQCCSVINSHTQDVKMITWQSNADIFASASYDDTIKLYYYDGDDWSVSDTLIGHSSTVWSISFNSQGDRLCSVSDDRTIKIWQRFKSSDVPGIVIVGSSNGKWKCVTTLSGYFNDPIYSVDWCHDSDLIVIGAGDNSIKLFKEDSNNDNSNQGSEDAVSKFLAPNYIMIGNILNAHDRDVNCVKWSSSSNTLKLLASSSDDCLIKLWKVIEL